MHRRAVVPGLLVLALCVACERSGSTTPPDATPATPVETPSAQTTKPSQATDAGPRRPNFRPYEVTEAARAVVDATDRSAEDREDDARRRPAELLTFAEVVPGLKVADLGAGSGYTAELLARAVGPDGEVWAQNDAFALENYAKDSWPQRLAKPVNAAIKRVDREFADPLPPEAVDLDLVTIIFAYHEAIARGQDPAAMNAKVFEHLRPGGYYVVVDHSAATGTGTDDTEKYHRVEEQTVIEQVEAAGFELAEAADFLRDPADTQDWEVWKRGFATDRFALKFQKPPG